MAVRMTTCQSLNLAFLITENPMSYDQIVKASGFNKVQVMRWVKRNRETIFIADWTGDKNGRLFVPMFQWGEGGDTPRPGPKQTNAERVRAYRNRKKGA